MGCGASNPFKLGIEGFALGTKQDPTSLRLKSIKNVHCARLSMWEPALPPSIEEQMAMLQMLLEGSLSKEDETVFLQAHLYTKQLEGILCHPLYSNIQNGLKKLSKHGKARYIQIISVRRIHELSVETKAELIKRVTKTLGNDRQAQEFVCRLFKATFGCELYKLKFLVDTHKQAEDLHNNMVQVIYRFIQSAVLRSEILQHFAVEATLLRHNRSFKPPMVVISDIDDTLVESKYTPCANKFPNWTIMPGVVQLYKELGGHVVFLTARPEFLESKTLKTLWTTYGFQSVTVLTGKLRDSLLIPFLPEACDKGISRRKFSKYLAHRQAFSECNVIFMGDSGQGDILTGLEMLAHDFMSLSMAYRPSDTLAPGKADNSNNPSKLSVTWRNPLLRIPEMRGNVKAVYIQDVSVDGVTPKTYGRERVRLRNEKGIVLCDNYLEVAIDTYKKDLISLDALTRVAKVVCEEFTGCVPQFEEERIRDARRKEFSQQFTTLNTILRNCGQEVLPTPDWFHSEYEIVESEEERRM